MNNNDILHLIVPFCIYKELLLDIRFMNVVTDNVAHHIVVPRNYINHIAVINYYINWFLMVHYKFMPTSP